jgi:methyl-accepting chemotaxis protein
VHNQRKKIWIDRFQTYLSVRLAVYFVLYQAAVWSLYVIENRFSTLGGTLGGIASAYGSILTPAASLTLGLLFIYDSVKLSHRIVGPLYRFRKTVQAVTAGEEVVLIRLREGDHLQEMRDDLNEMLRALEQRGAITLRGSPADAKVPQPATV